MTHTPEAHPPARIEMPPSQRREPWRRKFVPVFLRRERVAGQVVRFGVVGVMNTVVDFGLLNVFYHFFGWPLLLANTLSVSAGIANSFLWNKHWTFSSGGWRRWRREAIVFLAVSFGGLLINDAGIYALHTITGETSLLAVNLQKLGASVASMTWNFLGYRFLAFRNGPRSVDERA